MAKMTIEEIEEQIKKLEEAREEIKKEEREKLRKEKEKRKEEVDEALKKYLELRDSFVKDYGYYTTSNVASNKDVYDSLINLFI